MWCLCTVTDVPAKKAASPEPEVERWDPLTDSYLEDRNILAINTDDDAQVALMQFSK